MAVGEGAGRVCVGGTFAPLHRGHRALLDAACAEAAGLGSPLIVGLTTDRFALAARPGAKVPPYEERRAVLEAYLRSVGCVDAQIVPLDDPIGAAADPGMEAIVVSEGTRRTASLIARIRRGRGLPPLRVVVVPYVRARDGDPISASRVRSGEIDAEGKVRSWCVAVATCNPEKVEAVFAALASDILPGDPVGFRVEARPWSDGKGGGLPRGLPAIHRLAARRARSAVASGAGGTRAPHLGIGIEAGAVALGGRSVIVHVCVVADRGGRTGTGLSRGFVPPQRVELGRPAGIASMATGGRVTRRTLVAEAVELAILDWVASTEEG